MTKILIALVSLFILLLALLALDDITTGRQPDFYLEYAIVGLAALWFGGLAALAWRRRRGDGKEGRP